MQIKYSESSKAQEYQIFHAAESKLYRITLYEYTDTWNDYLNYYYIREVWFLQVCYSY